MQNKDCGLGLEMVLDALRDFFTLDKYKHHPHFYMANIKNVTFSSGKPKMTDYNRLGARENKRVDSVYRVTPPKFDKFAFHFRMAKPEFLIQNINV